jgi:hypothetical protein
MVLTSKMPVVDPDSDASNVSVQRCITLRTVLSYRYSPIRNEVFNADKSHHHVQSEIWLSHRTGDPTYDTAQTLAG